MAWHGMAWDVRYTEEIHVKSDYIEGERRSVGVRRVGYARVYVCMCV